MVDTYRTEEEQIAAIKNWWKRNGNAILIGVGLAMVIIFGWQYWQQQQAANRAAAANSFQELLAARQNPDPEKSEASVQYLADQLRQKHPGSPYAVFASLMQARVLVEQGKPEEAIAPLQWALDHAGDSPMPQVVRIRLAMAQYAAGQHEEALKTLAGIKEPGAFAAQIRELEGDIQLAMGNTEKAREAYRLAWEAEDPESRSVLLRLKMDDLAMPEAG